jgi:hypothetical protein
MNQNADESSVKRVTLKTTAEEEFWAGLAPRYILKSLDTNLAHDM